MKDEVVPENWPQEKPAPAVDGDELFLAGVHLRLDPAGALYWPQMRMLVVSDLHLEKGSAFARRGIALPPYDSRATLGLLERVVGRWNPKILVALGDSFHDRGGAGRLEGEERAILARLMAGRDMVWVAGNHDPDPFPCLGGTHLRELRMGGLVLRHEAEDLGRQENDPEIGWAGEISGHFHPVARLVVRGRSLRRRCFVSDEKRLVMPALGAYAGGLNVRDGAIAGLFAGAYVAHLAGGPRIYRIAHHSCLPERAHSTRRNF